MHVEHEFQAGYKQYKTIKILLTKYMSIMCQNHFIEK